MRFLCFWEPIKALLLEPLYCAELVEGEDTYLHIVTAVQRSTEALCRYVHTYVRVQEVYDSSIKILPNKSIQRSKKLIFITPFRTFIKILPCHKLPFVYTFLF